MRLSSDLRERALPLLILALALLLGAVARFNIVRTDFPYGDGGMFYVMVLDLKANHYALPETTTYNQRDIPYAYPPFAFYFTAALSDLTGISPLELIRVLPALFNLLTIPAIYLLANDILKSRIQAATAALVYAVLPVSFEWQIMGGGLTRSPGYLFAILTIEQAYRMYTTRERRYVASTAILGALSVLAHAQMGQFAAVGVAAIFLFRGLNRAGFIYSVIVVVGVVLMTLPWWGAVIGMHGVEPFRLAFAAAGIEVGEPELPMTTRIDTFLGGEMRYLNVIPILGLIYLVVQRQWLLPAWFVLNLLLAPRGAAARTGVMTGMFVAVALFEVALPVARGLIQKLFPSPLVGEGEGVRGTNEASKEQVAVVSDSARSRGRLLVKPALVVGLTALLSAYTILSPRNFEPLPTYYRFYSLSDAEQAAMSWVSRYTLPSCRFATLGPQAPWGRDAVGEWFPVLAERMAVTTVQGTEWLANPHQNEIQAWRATLNSCGTQDAACLERWRAQLNLDYTHIYIEAPERTECCGSLRRSLRESPAYSLIYSRDGIDIFARRDSACPIEP